MYGSFTIAKVGKFPEAQIPSDISAVYTDPKTNSKMHLNIGTQKGSQPTIFRCELFVWLFVCFREGLVTI